MNPEKILSSMAIKAAKDIVPDVYKDGLQPAVKELGKGLQTVAKLVNIALEPISGLVWGYEKIKEYLEDALSKRLSNITNYNIITPDPTIAGPVIEALRFAGHKEDLRELFTNLLATSMNEQTLKLVHPSFVEIIKQLSSTDAKLLKDLFCESRFQIPKIKIHLQISQNDSGGFTLFSSILPSRFYSDLFSYDDCITCLENLERLKIITISDYEISYKDYFETRNDTYDDIVSNFPLDYYNEASFRPDCKYLNIIKGNIGLTNFGSNFLKSVL